VTALKSRYYTVATIELHKEETVPFAAQLGWTPPAADRCLVPADRVFTKHGYLPPRELVTHLRRKRVRQVYVCGVQSDTCVLAAGFVLFDAGLRPTLLADLHAGSSLDRGGELGLRLWHHHFGAVIEAHHMLLSDGAGVR
jgi:nicotinamidase-related amidase